MNPARKHEPDEITTPWVRAFADALGVFNRFGWPTVICTLVTAGAIWGGMRIIPAIVAEYEAKTRLTESVQTVLVAVKDTMATMAQDMEHRRAEFAKYEAVDAENSRAMRERFDEAYQTMKEATEDRKKTNVLLERVIENQQKAITSGKTSGVSGEKTAGWAAYSDP